MHLLDNTPFNGSKARPGQGAATPHVVPGARIVCDRPLELSAAVRSNIPDRLESPGRSCLEATGPLGDAVVDPRGGAVG